MLASGMVVTGGSTLLQGLPELAEEILGMPVRRGVPQGIGGLSDVVKTPIYATAVGWCCTVRASRMGISYPKTASAAASGVACARGSLKCSSARCRLAHESADGRLRSASGFAAHQVDVLC